MSVDPVPRTTVLPWQGRRVSNRSRRIALNRERDALAGQLEAQIVTREGRALSAIERALLLSFVGCSTVLSDLDRRVARGVAIDHKAYSSLTANLIKLAARLGLDRPTSRANAKPVEPNVTTLAEYLLEKGATATDDEATDDEA
jgi:hypothetical protein